MTEEKLTQYGRIISRLRGVRSRQENAALRRGLLRWTALLFLVLLVSAGIEALFRFEVGPRTVLFLLTVLTVLGGFAWFVGPVLLPKLMQGKRKTDDVVALEVGGHFPDIRDRLLNVLQVVRQMRGQSHPDFSPELVDASFASVAGAFDGLALEPVVDTRPVRSAMKVTLFMTALCFAAFALLPSTMFEAVGRIVQFRTDFAPPAPFEFLVTPGDAEAVKGEEVLLTARTSAMIDPGVDLYIAEEGEENFNRVATDRDSSGLYTHRIPAVRTSFTYYAEANGFRSTKYRVEVVDRPFVRLMRLHLTFPSYTGLSPRYLEDNAGDVTALAGTQIAFEIAFNKEIASAVIVVNDSQDVPIAVDGEKGTAQLRMRQDARYAIRIVDGNGIPNASPITYTLRVVPDMSPRVTVIDPGKNIDIDESMRLPMLMEIADDFGFTSMRLMYRLAGSRYEKAQEEYTAIVLPLPSARAAEMEVPYIWNLASLGLVPEDVVSYYVEVYDNDNVNGPKMGRSEVYMLRLPSMEEMFARADDEQENAIEDLQQTLQKAEDIRKEMENLQREMKKENQDKLDWQQKKKLEELMQRQDQMLKEVQQINEKMQNLKSDMQQQNLISEETLRRYEEMQELMKQIDAPELRKMMERMNKAMEQLSPEQLKEAMENFTLNEEQFKQSIERTIELLKRIQIEQKVDELTKRAEDLANKQEELAKKTENADPKDQKELDRLAQEQRDLQKQAEDMQRELGQLQKMMQEFPQEMPLQEMQDAQSQLNLSQMQAQMNNAAGMCQGGNCQGASQQQKKMSEEMKKFQKKMEQMKKKLSENMQKVVQKGFEKALKQLLDLSMQQEELKNRVAQLPVNSQQYRDATREQLRIGEQLNNTANELMELAKKTFAVNKKMGEHIGKAMKQMRDATQSMQGRDQMSGGQQQGGAMAELNEAAKEIAKAMNSSQSSSSSGGSLSQQLQQMAQQQQMINEQSQQMGKMTQQQMAQQQRLLGQQKAVQKTLQDLKEEARNSEEGKKLLGDLDRIAQDMQEVVRDMQQNDINPNTLQRQERILSRLLDASRSMRERDWEKKRRSRSGSDITRKSPGQIDPTLLNAEDGIRRDLQQAIDEGYSRDYEERIRKYFDALQRQVLEKSGNSKGGN